MKSAVPAQDAEITKAVPAQDAVVAANDPTTVRDWEKFIIRIDMGNRPSTNPIKRDGTEGYPTGIQVIKLVRPAKASKEKIDIDLSHVDWRQIGSPNEFQWWFPKGAVQQGMQLKCDAVWEEAMPNSNVYRFNLKIQLPTLN